MSQESSYTPNNVHPTIASNSTNLILSCCSSVNTCANWSRFSIPSLTVRSSFISGFRASPHQFARQNEPSPFPSCQWHMVFKIWKCGYNVRQSREELTRRASPLYTLARPYLCSSIRVHSVSWKIIFQANLPCSPEIVSSTDRILKPPSDIGRHTLRQKTQWIRLCPLWRHRNDPIMPSIRFCTCHGMAIHKNTWIGRLERAAFCKVTLPPNDKNRDCHPSILLVNFSIISSKNWLRQLHLYMGNPRYLNGSFLIWHPDNPWIHTNRPRIISLDAYKALFWKLINWPKDSE